MKVIGVLLIIVALAIAILPQFFNCQYDGATITLPNGKTISMKCYWSARASLIVGIPLAFIGLFLVLAKKRETRMMLAVVGALLSAFAIALPTQLIGVCMDMTKQPSCLLVMKPALIGLGVAGVVLCLVALFLANRQADSDTPSEGAAA